MADVVTQYWLIFESPRFWGLRHSLIAPCSKRLWNSTWSHDLTCRGVNERQPFGSFESKESQELFVSIAPPKTWCSFLKFTPDMILESECVRDVKEVRNRKSIRCTGTLRRFRLEPYRTSSRMLGSRRHSCRCWRWVDPVGEGGLLWLVEDEPPMDLLFVWSTPLFFLTQ